MSERATIVAALGSFPARLRSAALAAALRPVHTGDWGPDEVARHLIACEMHVHQARLADLATVVAPTWGWAEPGPWLGEPELSLAALLERFAELRATTLASVVVLDEPGWANTGTHARLGRWDVAGLLRNAVAHDTEHLAGLG